MFQMPSFFAVMILTKYSDVIDILKIDIIWMLWIILIEIEIIFDSGSWEPFN